MRLLFKIKAMTFLLSMGLLKASSEGSNRSDSNWLESWIIPDPGIFLWTIVTFLIVLLILKVKEIIIIFLNLNYKIIRCFYENF